MSSRFVIMENGNPAARTPPTIILRDGLSVFALVFPLLWALWHRLWFAAGLIFLATVAFALLVTNPVMIMPVYVAMGLLAVLTALEGGQWRIAAMARRGYETAGIVVANTLEEAELLWAERRARKDDEKPAAVATPLASRAPARHRHPPDLLFSTPPRPR